MEVAWGFRNMAVPAHTDLGADVEGEETDIPDHEEEYYEDELDVGEAPLVGLGKEQSVVKIKRIRDKGLFGHTTVGWHFPLSCMYD